MSTERTGDAAASSSAVARIARTEIPLPWKSAKNWRSIVRDSSLPEAARSVIERVVRATRLWRGEKREVTRELVAHFADALSAGRTPEQAAAEFGDPFAAAKLIRRAKKRQRPLWWRAWRFSRRAACAAVLLALMLYGYLAARLWLHSPTISRDYVAELNARSMAAPEADRGWPLYLAALRAFEPVPQATVDAEWREWPAKPGDPTWPEARAWLERQRPALTLLRDAAAKPVLGVPFTTEDNPELAAAFSAFNRSNPPEAAGARVPETNAPLISVLFPHLSTMRSFARVVRMDATAAIEAGDAARLESDLHTLLGMMRHSAEQPTLIMALVRFAILHLTTEVIADALKSGLLDEAALTRLAHAVARFDDSELSIAPAMLGERMFLDDTLQRVYSDDGRGSGVPTAEGLRFLETMTANAEPTGLPAKVQAAAWPIHAGVMESRREMREAGERLYSAVRADAATPFWVHGEFLSTAQLQDLHDGERGRGFELLRVLAPSTDRALAVAEAARQRRDGTLLAIALELHRLRNGEYPAPSALETLTPQVLPEIPRDRFDGRPLRYLLVDGKPVVYSIGADLIDDGGRTPSETDAATVHAMDRVESVKAQLKVSRSSAPSASDETNGIGDWILYDRR